jgi:site-specific DNA-methyltransferase (adenine-specific)
LPESRGWIIWDKVAHMETLADCEMAWTSFDCNTKIFKHVRNTTEKRIHITQKPIALYKWLLTNYAKPGDKLFDSHSGSGSFRIAAYDMGFDLVSCELDPDYCRDNEARFQNHIKQIDLFKPEELQENIYQKELL